MKSFFVLGFSSVLLTACGATESLPEPESTAAKAFTARCSGCHALPHPARHTPQQWQHVVRLMEQRMAERSYLPMSDRERQAILLYLIKYAR